MKSIAFALDPNGYWIEIIQRGMDLPETKPAVIKTQAKAVEAPVKTEGKK